jgi:hypothetical protein
LLGILIDALVLMALLKLVNDDDIGVGTAVLVGLGASIGTAVLATFLVEWMGLAGIVVAAVIAAAILGVAVSALFGVEIKRSFLIGTIFVVVHVAVGIGFHLLLS